MKEQYLNRTIYKPYINIARCIGMLLVIVGHVSRNEYIIRTIYSFHMPLFFVLSGILYKHVINQRYFLKKKFISLIIPFIIFYTISLIYYWCLEIKFRDITIESEWRRLIPLSYGADIKGYMSHNIALWFLPALFTTEIIANFINTKITDLIWRITIVILISTIGFLLSFASIWNLPWGLSQALVMLFFYFIGIWLRPYLNTYIKKKFVIGLLLVCGFLFIINIGSTPRVDIASGKFPDLLSFIVNASLGLGIVILFSILLSKNKIMEFFGKGDITLCALALQGIVYRPLIFLDSKLIGYVNEKIDFLQALIISMLTYAICAILSYVYIKFQRKILTICKIN